MCSFIVLIPSVRIHNVNGDENKENTLNEKVCPNFWPVLYVRKLKKKLTKYIYKKQKHNNNNNNKNNNNKGLAVLSLHVASLFKIISQYHIVIIELSLIGIKINLQKSPECELNEI